VNCPNNTCGVDIGLPLLTGKERGQRFAAVGVSVIWFVGFNYSQQSPRRFVPQIDTPSDLRYATAAPTQQWLLVAVMLP